MIPGRPPTLLFNGAGVLLSTFSATSIPAAAPAFLPLVIDPNTVLPLTLLDPRDNRTVTIDRDGVTSLSWRPADPHPSGLDDDSTTTPAAASPSPGEGEASRTNREDPRLNLLVLYTDDLPGCQDFYENRGLHFTHEQHDAGPEHLAAALTDGVVFELYPADEANPAGQIRIGFTVPAAQRHPGAGVGSPKRDPDGRAVVVTLASP